MNRRFLVLLAWLVPPAVYLVLVAVAGDLTPVGWGAVGFTAFAYVATAVGPRLVPGGRDRAVHATPLAYVAGIYLMVQVVVGLVLVFAPEIVPGTAATVVQVVLAGLFALVFLGIAISNDHAAVGVERSHTEVAFLRTAAARLESYRTTVSDPALRRAIERLGESFRFSPTESSPAVGEIEDQLRQGLHELDRNLAPGGSEEDAQLAVTALSGLLEERNRLLVACR
ncbi:MAG: hypothetical protein JWR62_178 [Modestobacter sp.]|jgi:hypothetical protein|nr:hypothetical protein [Modestobacter sp.]